MKNFQLSTGNLRAKITRATSEYVILKISFEFQEASFITVSREYFNGLDSWVKENYKLIS